MGSPVLVTGASGFIGLNLCRRLVRDGTRVRALVRHPDRLTPLIRRGLDGCEIVQGDILDSDSVVRAMRGVENVYHVAGYVNLGPFRTRELTTINVDGTEIVCKAALSTGVRRLVHTSTVSTVASGSLAHPSDETTVYSGFDIPYFRTKREAEIKALAAGRDGKLEVVVVNPSFVVGAWDVKPTSGELILWAAKIGGLPFYARGALNVVDVDDVVQGHIQAMAKGRPNERYILGNENMPHRAFIDLIASTLGLRRAFMPIIEPLAYPLTIWGDLFGRMLPNVFENWNSFMLRVMRVEHAVSVEKARRELNLPQTPVNLAIRKAYDWFVEAGRLRPRRQLGSP